MRSFLTVGSSLLLLPLVAALLLLGIRDLGDFCGADLMNQF
jgi:hypothetical protein